MDQQFHNRVADLLSRTQYHTVTYHHPEAVEELARICHEQRKVLEYILNRLGSEWSDGSGWYVNSDTLQDYDREVVDLLSKYLETGDRPEIPSS